MEERERERERGIRGGLLRTYRQICQRLREIARLLRGRPSREEQNELNEEQRELRNRRRDLRERFFRLPEGERVKDIREGYRDRLNQAVKALRSASEENYPQENDKVTQLISELRAEAGQYKEPEDLEEELEGVAEDEFNGVIGHAEREQQRILREREEKGRAEDSKGAKNREAAKRYFMDELGMSENEAEDYMVDKVRREGADWSYPEFTREQVRLLQDLGEEGDRYREKILNRYFALIDSSPAEFTNDAVRMMGWREQNKQGQFRLLLTDIEGIEGKRITEWVSAETKMRSMLHDGAAVIEQGAGKPEDYKKMMERFTTELFDQLFTHPYASLAARLYEVGTDRLRAVNSNEPPPYPMMVRNPKSGPRGSVYIDEWVRDRFKEVIIAKKRAEGVDYTSADYDNDWPEEKIRQVMALGKGFELVTIRLPELVARGRATERSIPEKIVSVYAEDFVRPLEPIEHLIEKLSFEDPSMMFMLFVATRGKVLPSSSRAEIERQLAQAYGVDPRALRMKDLVNFFKSGVFSGSTWRGDILSLRAREADPRMKKLQGLNFMLDRAEEEAKECNMKPEEVKSEIWRETLERNPIRVLREAELHDGEVFDEEERIRYHSILPSAVQEMVIRRTMETMGVNADDIKREIVRLNTIDPRTNRRLALEEWIEDKENPLLMLTQIAVEQRSEQIDYRYIADSEARSWSKAYHQAIREVVTDKKRFERIWTEREIYDKNREWRRREKPMQIKGSLLEFLSQKKLPFAPTLDDIPWEEFNFADLGQKGFARRLRDYAATHEAMIGLNNLKTHIAKYRTAEDIIMKGVEPILEAVRHWSGDHAREVATTLYEGIGRANAANFWKRLLPAPFGSVADWMGDNLNMLVKDEKGRLKRVGLKPTSFAKEIFGSAANSWRAIDLRNFLKHARLNNHITFSQEALLRKKLRCTTSWIILEGFCRWTPGGLAIIGFAFIKQLLKQLEEQIKEQS